jgi:hypothetical protein
VPEPPRPRIRLLLGPSISRRRPIGALLLLRLIARVLGVGAIGVASRSRAGAVVWTASRGIASAIALGAVARRPARAALAVGNRRIIVVTARTASAAAA